MQEKGESFAISGHVQKVQIMTNFRIRFSLYFAEQSGRVKLYLKLYQSLLLRLLISSTYDISLKSCIYRFLADII